MSVALSSILPAAAVLVGAAFAAAVLSSLLPVRAIALLWGILLPINSTVFAGASALAVAKVLGAMVITYRCRREDSARAIYRWAMPLWILGGVLLVDGLTTPTGSRALGSYIIVSAAIGLALCKRPSVAGPILVGFASGCILSAAVLIMQVLEMPTIGRPGPADDSGRYAGLSMSAIMASTEFAIACMVLFVRARAQIGRPLWTRVASTAGALVCLSGLLASGGRGGLAALTLGAAVAAYQRIVKVKHLIFAGAGVWLTFYVANAYKISFSTLDRVEDLNFATANASSLTSNRDVIFHESLVEFMKHPILGPGYGYFIDTYGIMPHFAPLTFAVGSGLTGAAIGLYLMMRLARLALSRDRRRDAWSDLAPPVAVVLLVMSSLEAEGPFMSIGLTSILLICASAASVRPRDFEARLVAPQTAAAS